MSLDLLGGDIESAKNLNHCRETIASLLNSFMQEGVKKVDKVGEAQSIVE